MSIRSLTQEDPIGLAGGLNLYGFADADPVNFSDPFGLCPPKWLCDLIGASAGESSLEHYAQVATDPSSSRVEKFGATVGGLFAALWTPDTYLQTATTLTGAAGASRVLVGRAAATTAVEGVGAQVSRGALGAMERQLATAGRGSVEETIRTLTRRIAQHEADIATYRAAGGNVSSMEHEIRAWRETIDAARKVLGIQ